MIKNDATTIWELWNGNTADPAMNSHNHVRLLGDLLVWFYENLAGIKNDPSGAAFKKILMAPVFPDKLDHVTAGYDSPHGLIESAWRRDGDLLTWNITIPANTTATVKLPARFGTIAVTGGTSPLTASPTDGTTTIDLGSGRYTLTSSSAVQ
jgi:alpha-L-rhamnosidase